jgi:hypothetical protein
LKWAAWPGLLQLSLTEINAGMIRILSYFKRQSPSDFSKDRTRNYRERLKKKESEGVSNDRHGDVTVTPRSEQIKPEQKKQESVVVNKLTTTLSEEGNLNAAAGAPAATNDGEN